MRRFTFGDFPLRRTQLKSQVRHLREELKMSRAAQELQLCSLSRQVLLQSNNIFQILFPLMSHLVSTSSTRWAGAAPWAQPASTTTRQTSPRSPRRATWTAPRSAKPSPPPPTNRLFSNRSPCHRAPCSPQPPRSHPPSCQRLHLRLLQSLSCCQGNSKWYLPNSICYVMLCCVSILYMLCFKATCSLQHDQGEQTRGGWEGCFL